MKKKKDAFTLLETLVVISLISVMVSLLLPALASAQATARLAPWGQFSDEERSGKLVRAAVL